MARVPSLFSAFCITLSGPQSVERLTSRKEWEMWAGSAFAELDYAMTKADGQGKANILFHL